MSVYEIVSDFRRPDPDLVRRANGLYFCIVGCRVGPRYVMDTGIKPLDKDWRICGQALTVRPEDVIWLEVRCGMGETKRSYVFDTKGRLIRQSGPET